MSLTRSTGGHDAEPRRLSWASTPGKGTRKKTKDISFCGQGHLLISTVPAEHWSISFSSKKKNQTQHTKKNFAVAFIISKIKRTIHNGITGQGYCKNCRSRATLQPNYLKSLFTSRCQHFVRWFWAVQPYPNSLQVPGFSILAKHKPQLKRAAFLPAEALSPFCAELQHRSCNLEQLDKAAGFLCAGCCHLGCAWHPPPWHPSLGWTQSVPWLEGSLGVSAGSTGCQQEVRGLCKHSCLGKLP